MSSDYLEYQFEQAVGAKLKNILRAEDLANMVITVNIEFKNKKETEEEKEAREKEEKKYAREMKRHEFKTKWTDGANNRYSRKRKGLLDNDGIIKERADLYEEIFGKGEIEDRAQYTSIIKDKD